MSNKQPFRWGVIGTGGIANAFKNDLAFLAGHEISAVLSRSMHTAESFSSNIANCKPFEDPESFMRSEEIDAVYIATPNNLHFEQTIMALQNGKHVLCEKPFAMNSSEVKSMVDASKSNNVALLEGMWTRYLPHIDIIRGLLNENLIGDVQSVFACHGQDLTHSNNPRLWTKELGGGALLDLGIYVVSLAHMVLGRPKNIKASAVFTEEGVDAKTSMIFTYESGAIADLSCSMYDTQPNRAVISGSKGYIEIAPTFYAPTTITLNTSDGRSVSYPNDYKGHGLREQAYELANCVKNNEIESQKLKHSESIAVMGSMDEIREQIGLTFNQ